MIIKSLSNNPSDPTFICEGVITDTFVGWQHEPTVPGYYYWDETWGNCCGPFVTEEDMKKNLAEYCTNL